MTWIGRKKLALVPLYRPHAHPPDVIPANWNDEILRRMLFDPDPTTGADRSLRAYIHTVSSGRADLDVVIQQMAVVDQQDVPPNILEATLGAQLRAQGFNAAAIVMLGGIGAGTNSGFWSRFVMVEGVGVWAMEFIHSLTGFADLYSFNGNMGAFDEMACACGTHPSAYTKRAIGWMDASAITTHTGHVAGYDLHAVGLVQPPPSNRWAAIRIGVQVPYLMVEARQKVDQFDVGIHSEGVIVYRVQTSNPLGWSQNQTAPIKLLTTTALTAGQTFTSDTGITVQVSNALPGGFSIIIDDPTVVPPPTTAIVPDVLERTAAAAANLVSDAGLVPGFTGQNHTGSWVSSQSPTAGNVVARGSTVTMHLRTGPIP
jgi:PASTA domain-containing protein